MHIEQNIVERPFSQALPEIKRKLSGYMSWATRIYIGVTTNRHARASRHAQNGWQRMVILYEAWGAKLAADMEHELIAWAQECNFNVEHWNAGGGGEGIVGGAETYEVYVLIG